MQGSKGPTSSSATGDCKLRLRVKTTVHGQLTLMVKTRASVTVRQLKMALEVYRGINVADQELAVWRGQHGYVNLDDAQRLNQCKLTTGDRLFLLPVVRTGPGSGLAKGKHALVQLAEETTEELLKIMEHLREELDPSSSNECFLLLRRSDAVKMMEESPSPAATAVSKMEEMVVSSHQLEESTSTETLRSEETMALDLLMKEKLRALKAKMEEHRRLRELRTLPGESKSDQVESGSVEGPGQRVSEENVVDEKEMGDSKPPPVVCDQCGEAALWNGRGECPRCAGRFCARHIIRTGHSCLPALRCSVCEGLVLIAGGRHQCPRCSKPMCRRHIGQPCHQGHGENMENRFVNGCRQQ